MSTSELKQMLLEGAPAFWTRLRVDVESAADFVDLTVLSALRKKALARKLPAPRADTTLRLAIMGGCSLYPLHDLLVLLLEASGVTCELFLGSYDNYVAEIVEPDSTLYTFAPQAVLLLPSAARCRYGGELVDGREVVQAAVNATARQLFELCGLLHERSGAEIVLANFPLPSRHDLGALRTKAPGSDWNFKKWLNLELGLQAPSYVQICDLEFLASRRGGLASEAGRGWFESKQPCSPDALVDLSREVFRLLRGLREPSKKVLVLDLDNTLWGGVIAEDGLEGIELGDTSPRGEAFKAFQRAILALKKRGVLLGVCSKNDHQRAAEAFEKHPEMLLRMSDLVSFKADWEPKSDNLRRMAEELRLGLDSFVFVDDNPAEIDIVRQFAPGVTTILLGDDPAEYAGQLQDCRLFEPRAITSEDRERTRQYRSENERTVLLASATNMDAYLASLDMQAAIKTFTAVDVPRLSQLINKSNQFNLTTRRRSEADVEALIRDPNHVCFSVRLSDRFGDHGLISIVIGRLAEAALEIDTWVMSCRVLKRQVEEVVLNRLMELAQGQQHADLRGVYLATPKNDMVRDLYPRLGFRTLSASDDRGDFALDVATYVPRGTRITVRLDHDAS